MTNYGGTNSQEVRFGENILDLSSEIDASDIATVLIPEGAEVDGERVNITSVNGGVNYIQDAQAVARWGKIWAYAQFDDITEPADLLEAAQDYLAEVTTLPRSIDLTAFDLSLTDTSIEALELGYWTIFTSQPHGLSGTYLLQKLVRHLTAPQNDKVTFGIVKKYHLRPDGQHGPRGVSTDRAGQTIRRERDGREDRERHQTYHRRDWWVFCNQPKRGRTAQRDILDGRPHHGGGNKCAANQSKRDRFFQKMVLMVHTLMPGPSTAIWWRVLSPPARCWRTASEGERWRSEAPGTAANGVIYVKNASGTIIAQIDKNGITINQGSINLGNGAF